MSIVIFASILCLFLSINEVEFSKKKSFLFHEQIKKNPFSLKKKKNPFSTRQNLFSNMFIYVTVWQRLGLALLFQDASCFLVFGE